MALRRSFPAFGWFGIVSLAAAWAVNWGVGGRRTIWTFFPLWVGYSLAVEGLVNLRTGSCMLRRSRVGYAGLFALSAALWWGFEILDWRLGNWEYVGVADLHPLLRILLQSVAFSTVVPSLLSTVELTAGFLDPDEAPGEAGPRRPVAAAAAASMAVAALLLGFALWKPRFGFPAAWLFLIPLLEPGNLVLGQRSVAWWVRRRSWKPLAAVALAGLTCGFLWELWNYRSYPRWEYHIPFFGSPHLFAMPLAGYLGYPFFALEVLVLVRLLTALSARRVPSLRGFLPDLPPYGQGEAGRARAAVSDG